MKNQFLLLSLVTILAISLNAQIIHVPSGQPTIQAGINAAINGDTVLVNDGTYYENIRFMGKAITVASEFIMDGDTNHINNTIIDGSQALNSDSAATIMFINGEDTTSVINGFTVTSGKGVFYTTYQAQCGGGIFTYNSGSKIINNKIVSNKVEGSVAGGAGIQSWWGNNDPWTVIENNFISNNMANATGYTAFGGGICATTNAIIKNNIIHNNSCTNENQYADGGGIEVDIVPGASIYTYIYNNSIQFNIVNGDNSCWGAGISFQNGAGIIGGNLIANNEANSEYNSYGAGICITSDENVSNQNNTIVNNSAVASGGGIYTESINVELTNCIVWDNTPDQIQGSFIVSYSDIMGIIWPGQNNINEDPQFAASGVHPFSLLDDSPCVNTGTPNTTGLDLLAYDLASNHRFYGGRIEIGAYENQNVILTKQNEQFIQPDFILSVYPNPITDQATINFTLPNPSYIILSILDFTGKEVKTIEAQKLPKGEYNFELKPNGLIDGNYIIQLKTEKSIRVQKVVIIE